MRWQTEAYRELNTPLDRVVGGRTAGGLAKLGLHAVGDLLRQPPRRYINGTDMSDFSGLVVDEDVAIIARVHAVEHAYGAKQRVKATLTDDRGHYLSATFFGSKDWLIQHWLRVLTKGVRGIFVGKVGEFKGTLQLAHPDFVLFDEHNRVVAGKEAERQNREAMVKQVQRDTLVGIYPASKATPTWIVADSVALALDVARVLREPLPEWILDQADVMELAPAFEAVHAPATNEEAEVGVRRLRFDEALQTQLSLSYRRAERQAIEIAPIAMGPVLAAFDEALPFTLTDGQRLVSDEIFGDLASTTPMSRLLQGEVGSGKTVVALRAMLAAIDSGGQAALLAPTEVLAKQHFRSIMALLGDLAGLGGIHVELLTGSRTTAAKRDVQSGLATGEVSLVVGTHALLGQGIEFANLMFVVVDEQHRFGVEQRAALATRGATAPHMLVMTATPIPRSVAMTVFGDLDVSSLRGLPAGRADVKTVYVNTAQHPHWVTRAWERVREEVAGGRQAFVVCPRIDLDDADVSVEWLEEVVNGRPLAAVIPLSTQLRTGPLHDLRIGIAHGRQSVADRDETMFAFASGKLDVLVATTVVEVGIDVPNASMMVVMDADSFGLAQLHQLRGRIGRGSHEGLCLLLAPVPEPGTPAEWRLNAMVSTRDGFELAEVDMRLRREGNVLGAEQSGTASGLKLLRVLDDIEVITQARMIADRVAADDPAGEQPWVHDMLRQADEAGEWASRS